MPVLANTSSLLDAVMNELRIPVSNLTERTKITAQMSYVYGDICAKQDWWWLQRQAIRNTHPKITAGTVSVTENSTAITFSTAPQQFSANVSVASYIIAVEGNAVDSQSIFRLATHTSGATAATLDGEYTGDTDTAASYRLYKVSYALPSNLAKLLEVKRYGFPTPLQRVGIEDLTALQINSRQEGKPQAYSIFDFETEDDPSTTRLMQIWPFPDQAYRMEIWYKAAQLGDLSDIALPKDYQQVLVYGTLSRCYIIFLNDAERSQFFLSLFNDVLALMASQQREYASDHPGIAPAADLYRTQSAYNRRWRRSLGSYFDILPNQP